MKAIVIGGVAAGMSAASKIRRQDPGARVLVFERGTTLSYGACGLPYLVGGDNDDPGLLIARTKEQFERQGMEIFLRHEAIGLDPACRTLRVRNLDTGAEFSETYDRLLIAVGCDSAVLPIPGADLPGVYRLRNMEDGLLLRELVTRPETKRAVIIGGGYIGVEMAEALRARGLSVTMLEAAERLLLNFEPEFSQLAAEELAKNGVAVRLPEGARSIASSEDGLRVRTDLGEYAADLVLMSAGIVPATAFLRGSGIRLAGNGAVLVDRQMRSSLPDVWAAGDCALIYNRVSGEDSFQPLGTVANKCGRLAGANMAGLSQDFPGALGSAAIKVFGLEMARTGLSARDALRLGLEADATSVSVYDHAPYYPGRKMIRIQLLCEKGSRRILGACAAGAFGCGAVLRINALAMAIHAGLSADEVGMVDLAYAPPFASAWDALHIAANAVK